MNNVTRVLSALEAGDPDAAERLLPLVYQELRTLAASRLAAERPGGTLDATSLVHEAYLRLVGGGSADGWNSRGHFFAAAAEAMRRILIEAARRRARTRHGGGMDRVDADLADLPTRMPPEELIALDEALEALKLEDPRKARLVDLRYFAGLTIEQAAEALGVSRTTAHREWTYARAWLHRRIRGDDRD